MKLLNSSPRRREQGMAVIVVLTLLSIVLIYASFNARTLHNLGRELVLVEREQIHRLNSRAGVANAASAALHVTNTNSTQFQSASQ